MTRRLPENRHAGGSPGPLLDANLDLVSPAPRPHLACSQHLPTLGAGILRRPVEHSMNGPMRRRGIAMQDVQSRPDSRGIDIQHVGVKNVHLPLKIAQKGGGYQSVLGNVSLSVDLPMQFKGTHMSRFMSACGWSGEPLEHAHRRGAGLAALAASAPDSHQVQVLVNKKAPVGRSAVLITTASSSASLTAASTSSPSGWRYP